MHLARRPRNTFKQRITGLGLRYSLLTQYTGFIATLGTSLAAEVPSTPEPESLGAIAVVLSMLAMLRRRARRHDARRWTS
jgi:Ca-activated chloride channel family protein